MNAVHGDLPRIGLIGAFACYPDALSRLMAADGLHALASDEMGSGKGVTIHDTIAGLAAASDVVICHARDEQDFAGLTTGPGGLAATARRGQVVLDISSVPPTSFLDAVAMCAAAGVRLCGAALHVRADGEGGFLASADDETFRDSRLMRILEAFASEVHRVGGVGSSKSIAVIEGHLAAVSVAASGEAVMLGAAAGIPEDRMVPLLQKGSGANAVLRFGSAVEDGWRAPTVLRSWLKRSNLLGRSVRHPSWFGAVAADTLGRASASSAAPAAPSAPAGGAA